MYCSLSYRWMFGLAAVLGSLLSLGLAPQGAPAQDDPFSTEKKPDPKAKGKEGDETPLALQRKREHPVIASLKDHPPKTLPEVMRAIKLMVEINRPDAFRPYAEQFIGLKPTDQQLAAFHEQYGGAFFWELARRREFAPEGREIGDLVIEAAANHAQDAKLLSAEIPKLYEESSRKLALQRILQGGPAGANALLKASLSAKSPEQHEQLQNALAALKKDALGPCLAALQAQAAAIRVNASLALGKMRSTEAVLFLVGPAVGVSDEAGTQAARDALLMRTKRLPDATSVAEFLEKQMNYYLAGQLPAEPDADELIPLWMWNEKETLAELKRYPREDASLIYAARLATQLARLVPKSPETRKRTMLVRLEAERNLNGLDHPPVKDATSAYAEAAKSETTFLDEVLQMALKERRYGAATTVIEIMGASGDSLLLQRKQGPHATLIDALNCSDQRTQFAALQAVSALADEHPFAGSSRVVETAAYLLTGQGQPTILVAHPRLEEGTRIATLFTDLGFTSEIATHGNELARRAKANADIELILASDLLHRPSVLESTQMLRQDIHSAAIPLGILRHEAEQGSTYWNDVNVIHMGQHLGGLNAANAWAPPGIIRARGADAAKDADKLAEVISPPQSLDTARWQVQHLQKLGGRRIVPSEVRTERASLVLDTILKLVSQDPPTKYHDFQRLELALQSACDNSSLMERALQALGKIGSPQAQLFLAQQASLRGLAEANRKAAIAALEIAVKKRGLLLTQARLEMQYIMFNESRESDVEHSAILGELLDVVESPLKQRTALE